MLIGEQLVVCNTKNFHKIPLYDIENLCIILSYLYIFYYTKKGRTS